MKSNKMSARGQPATGRGKGRPFKKGQSGNVKGGPKKTPQQRAVDEIERWRLDNLYTEIAHLTIYELKAKEKDVMIDAKTKAVVSLFLKATNGDGWEWERLLSRRFGKPRESIALDVSGKLSLIDIARQVEDRQ